jgi:hypothetical protein
MTAEIVDLVGIMARRAAFDFTPREREAVIDAFRRAGVFDFYYLLGERDLPRWFEFRTVPDGRVMTLGKICGEFILYDLAADRVLAGGADLGLVLARIARPPLPANPPRVSGRGGSLDRR